MTVVADTPDGLVVIVGDALPLWTPRYGAFMEQSGRNQWQPASARLARNRKRREVLAVESSTPSRSARQAATQSSAHWRVTGERSVPVCCNHDNERRWRIPTRQAISVTRRRLMVLRGTGSARQQCGGGAV